MLVTHLKGNRTSDEMISKLQIYIEDEEFETDSIQMDDEEAQTGQITGNISSTMENHAMMIAIHQFVGNNKS